MNLKKKKILYLENISDFVQFHGEKKFTLKIVLYYIVRVIIIYYCYLRIRYVGNNYLI